MSYSGKEVRTLSLFAGVETTQFTGFTTIASFEFNLSENGGLSQALFRAIMSTTNSGDAAEIRLFNITTESVVSSSTQSTSATDPTLISVDVLSNLAAGSNLYEVQIRLQTTGSPNICTCYGAELQTL